MIRLLTCMIMKVLFGLPEGLAASTTSAPVGTRLQQDATPKTKEGWEAVVNLQPFKAYEDYQEPMGYWVDLGILEYHLFWEHIAVPENHAALVYFVRQFGKHSPKADMRWIMAETNILLPGRSIGPPRVKVLNDPKMQHYQKYASKELKLQLAVCRELVSIWRENPKLLDRYYQMLIWGQEYLGPPRLHATMFDLRMTYLEKEFITEKESEYFWWKCREFMLLAHMTGRDDLWIDQKVEDYSRQCAKWVKWVKINAHFFIADNNKPVWHRISCDQSDKIVDNKMPSLLIPSRPFPDYRGPEIEHPREIMGYIRSNTFWSENRGILLGDVPAEKWIESRRKSYETAKSRPAED